MKEVDRWILPDGIEELLPSDARQLESYRRRLVDLFQAWGYDYVIPPLVEFTDSLLTGSGRDISELTFKINDQFSGKTMGVRADITPQVARMDAHSLKRDGVNRLCYAGHVLHARPKWPLSSRSPVQAGVELFGEAAAEADLEVVSLLLASLETLGLERQYIDLGHVDIFRTLAECGELDPESEIELFELLQTKQFDAIDAQLATSVSDAACRAWLSELAKLNGDRSVLKKARAVLADAPARVYECLDQLDDIATALAERFPRANLYFDLSELRGYHYQTGLVFGAFMPGVGNAVALGGRYDRIGEAFGRARPATGFTIYLSALCRYLHSEQEPGAGIFAPSDSSADFYRAVSKLRAAGERVVCGFNGQQGPHGYQACDRILRCKDGAYVIEPIDE